MRSAIQSTSETEFIMTRELLLCFILISPYNHVSIFFLVSFLTVLYSHLEFILLDCWPDKFCTHFICHHCMDQQLLCITNPLRHAHTIIILSAESAPNHLSLLCSYLSCHVHHQQRCPQLLELSVTLLVCILLTSDTVRPSCPATHTVSFIKS